ncbi:MAG TPA: hypothetical protein VK166_18245 [Chitinophagaceae bacterium]|nr:hypothetical protein [Chitinophagaceae bacterium]
MKKIIYPIIAALVLSGFSAFAQTDTPVESRNKPFISYHFHDQFNGQEAVTKTDSDDSSITTELTRVDIFTPSFQSSDELIDRQFTTEETTIEIPRNVQTDEIINSQFDADNKLTPAQQ